MKASERHPQWPLPLLVSPIGAVSRELCAEVGQKVGTFFGCLPVIRPLLADIEFAYDSGRRQYHSTPILDALEEMASGEFLKILAITREDLFIPILTHVYGEAQLDGRACIVSTFRLDEDLPSDRSIIVNRVIKEAIHELGHTFNLRHCPDSSCLMHYCRSLKDVNLKSDQFCRYCTVLLSDAMEQFSPKADSQGPPN